MLIWCRGTELRVCYLEVARTLNREDEDDEVLLHEGLGEFALITGRCGPDTLLLGYFYTPTVATFHDEVAYW